MKTEQFAEFLKEHADQFELETVSTEIDKLLHERLTLNLGFLGEFNAGKTSLINALLGRRILPEGVSPTTGAVTYIEVSAGTENIEYAVDDEDGVRGLVSVTEFNSCIMGETAGRPVLLVSPVGVLQDGYRLVDTPGLASLDKIHAEITLGYLPHLDGGILCQDIAKGGLSASVVDFLDRPDVRPLRQNFIVALCQADTTTEGAVRNIRQKVLDTMRDLYSVDDWNQVQESERVVVTSAHQELTGNQDGTGDLEKAIIDVFLARRVDLVRRRRALSMNETAKRLSGMLADLKRNLSLTDEELEARERELAEAVNETKAARNLERQRLRQFGINLRDQLGQLTEEYAAIFQRAGKGDLDAVCTKLGEQITLIVSESVRSYNENLRIPDVPLVGYDVSARIETIMQMRDLGVLLATAVLVATAGPATGTGNIVEATAGAAAARGSKAGSSIGNAGRQADVAGKAAEAVSAMSKGAKFMKFLAAFADAVKDMNPLEHVGDVVAGRIKASAAKDGLSRAINRVADQVEERVAVFVNGTVFEPMEQDLARRQTMVTKAIEVRRRSEADRKDQYRRLEKSIEELARALEGFDSHEAN